MELTIEQIRQITTGASYLEEQDGWISFSRFTKSQRAYLMKEEMRALRVGAAAGMKLDFFTDASAVSFAYETVRASGQNWCYFDVYVDRELRLHEGKKGVEDDRGTIELAFPSGRKQVTVYLPCLFSVRISDFTLTDATEVEPVRKSKKMLFFGDSITQGYTAEFPSLTYAHQLCDRMDAELFNQAIGGDKFDADLLDESLGFPADTVFVAYGTNDWSNDAAIEREASRFLEKLTRLYADAKIVLILPLWRKDYPDLERAGRIPFLEAREQIRRACAPYPQIQIVDGFRIVPHMEPFFQDLRLHPNDLGFLMMANAITKELRD